METSDNIPHSCEFCQRIVLRRSVQELCTDRRHPGYDCAHQPYPNVPLPTRAVKELEDKAIELRPKVQSIYRQLEEHIDRQEDLEREEQELVKDELDLAQITTVAPHDISLLEQTKEQYRCRREQLEQRQQKLKEDTRQVEQDENFQHLTSSINASPYRKFRNLPRNATPIFKAYVRRLTIPNVLVFDISVEEARNAGEKGCGLMLSILSLLPASQPTQGVWIGAMVDKDLVQFGLVSVRTELDFLSIVQIPEFVSLKAADFRPLASASQMVGKEVDVTPINPNPASGESFNLYRKWMNTCLDSHSTCSKPTGNFFPTRLLEILNFGSETSLRLCQFETGISERQTPYVALSYCWGGDQALITTKRNLAKRLIGIDIEELPQTIKDAIVVAGELGLRYIWIDSLCILQDSPEDKAVEISQMPQVYNQATITIAASRSSDVRQGFIHCRSCTEFPITERKVAKGVFELRYQTTQNKYSSMVYAGSIMLIPHYQGDLIEPLSTRGWALQERLLSTRVLDFGALETRWLCLEIFSSINNRGEYKLDYGRNCSDGLTGDKSISLYKDVDGDLFRLVLNTLSKLARSHHTPSSRSRLFSEWEALVQNYSRRRISLLTDRLPAISGIAMRYAAAFNDSYCAGLWRSNLHSDLLWGSCEPEPRPLRYQGPSWSWAGINGEVKFPDLRGYTTAKDFQILDCRIQLADESEASKYEDLRYGLVQKGELVIQCPLYNAFWHKANTLCKHPVLSYDRDNSLKSTVYLDTLLLEDSLLSQVAVTLVITMTKNEGLSYTPRMATERLVSYVGLILWQNTDNSNYIRMGTFELGEWSKAASMGSNHIDYHLSQNESLSMLLDHGTIQTITIV